MVRFVEVNCGKVVGGVSLVLVMLFIDVMRKELLNKI